MSAGRWAVAAAACVIGLVMLGAGGQAGVSATAAPDTVTRAATVETVTSPLLLQIAPVEQLRASAQLVVDRLAPDAGITVVIADLDTPGRLGEVWWATPHTLYLDPALADESSEVQAGLVVHELVHSLDAIDSAGDMAQYADSFVGGHFYDDAPTAEPRRSLEARADAVRWLTDDTGSYLSMPATAAQLLPIIEQHPELEVLLVRRFAACSGGAEPRGDALVMSDLLELTWSGSLDDCEGSLDQLRRAVAEMPDVSAYSRSYRAG